MPSFIARGHSQLLAKFSRLMVENRANIYIIIVYLSLCVWHLQKPCG